MALLGEAAEAAVVASPLFISPLAIGVKVVEVLVHGRRRWCPPEIGRCGGCERNRVWGLALNFEGERRGGGGGKGEV